MKKIIITILSFAFLVSTISAARIKRETEKVDMDGADKIMLKGELGAGEFKIMPKDQDEAFIANISYSPDDVEYWVNSKIRSDKCIIDIGSERENKHSLDSEKNRWEILLSKKHPIEIDFEIGACESDFELGGIPIEELTLEVGAADASISFSERNPTRLKAINIDAGACSLDMQDIGNANFESFKIEGGAGSFDLDFLGEYEGVSRIDIEIGLGSADIVLPKNVPVQIHTDGSNWLSSIDIHNNRLDEVEDDLFESDDFEDADTKIIMYVSVGLGSVDIRFRR